MTFKTVLLIGFIISANAIIQGARNMRESKYRVRRQNGMPGVIGDKANLTDPISGIEAENNNDTTTPNDGPAVPPGTLDVNKQKVNASKTGDEIPPDNKNDLDGPVRKDDDNVLNVPKPTNENKDLLRLFLLNEEGSYGKVSFGTPEQDIEMFIDSRSPVLAVPSSKRRSCKQTYNSKNSKTHEPVNISNYMGEYRGGTLEGFYSNDTITIKDVAVKYQQFIEKTSAPRYHKCDGILGLGFDDEHPKGYPALISNMMEQGVLKRAVVSMLLGPVPQDTESQLIFGGSDKELYRGSLSYAKVKAGPEWRFPIERITLNGETVCSDCSAVIDTSRRYIYVPSKQIDKIKEILNMCFLFGIKIFCDVDKLPNMVFNIGSKTFALKGKDYIIGQMGTCRIRLRKSRSDFNWILGYEFLKHFYTEFDFDGRQIGFAKV